MAKTIQNLLDEVDANVTSNNNNEITGPILNGVLKNIVRNTQNYFLFPKDAGVGSGDIGKLVMNDGSGTAKVYQLSPATTDQPGRWIITLADIGDTTDDSTFNFDTLTYSESFDRVQWRQGDTPTTVNEELNLIKDYIDGNANLSTNITATVDGDELTIEENDYDGTVLKLDDFDVLEGSYVDTPSRPALPAAPTAFPLGKLIGIDGDNAIISSTSIETYVLDGSMTINHSVFNLETDFDITGIPYIVDMLEGLAVVPAADGKAKAINMDDFLFDNRFSLSWRHQILGLALSSGSGTVTVLSLNHLSLFLGFALKIKDKTID